MVVTYALAAPVAFTVIAAAMNYSVVVSQRGYIRAAADAAALSAAGQLALSNVSLATVQNAAINMAQENLTANPYAKQPDVITATVNADHTAVTVTVQRFVEAIFINYLGVQTSPISATATATFRSSPVCVLILDPSASNAFNAFGNSAVTAPNCAI